MPAAPDPDSLRKLKSEIENFLKSLRHPIVVEDEEALFDLTRRARSVGASKTSPFATADGQRFLGVTTVEQRIASPLNMVMNWTAGLKK